MDPCIVLIYVISFPLFNYHTLNSGIVINNFSKTLCCMKWTKNYKPVLIIGFWM
jgi:hypothetical protein